MTYQKKEQPNSILVSTASRPLACVCAAFSGAILLGIYLLDLRQILLLGGLMLFAGAALFLRRHKLLGAVFLAAVIGMLLCWYWQGRVVDLERNWVGRIEPLVMEVTDYPEESLYGSYVETNILSEGELHNVHLLLYVSDPDLDVKPGSQLSAYVRLRTARGDQDPWVLYNYSNGIFLQGSAKYYRIQDQPTPFRLLPRVWAHGIGQSLHQLFPDEEAGFLFALTTGTTVDLSPELDYALKETGLRHIVAASGLHVNVLITVLFLLPGNRKRKGILFLPALLAFAALAGFSPSICRASIMEAIILLAPLVEREEDGLTSLSLALALIVAGNPYAVTGVGLQLSFCAMLGLLTISPSLRNPKRGKIWNSLVTTLGANVLTLPLVLYYFGSFSLLTPLSNLVVLWVIPFLMPAGLTVALLGQCLPWLAGLAAVPVGKVAEGTIIWIYTISRLPHANLSGGDPMVIAWLLLAYLIGGLIYWKKLRGRAALAFGLALLPALMLCFWKPEQAIPPGGMQISLLDVGQGQCILILSESDTVVIDCGSEQERADEALKSALSRQHRDHIDLLILTHYDSDHINGLPEVTEEYPVYQLLAPQPTADHEDEAAKLWSALEAKGATVTVSNDDERVQYGSIAFSTTAIGTDRNSGLAILVSQDEFDLLVTGDANLEAEQELVSRWTLPKIEVLVAGHHGSKYATGESLLAQGQPDSVLISVGSNSYGHPTEETLDRCEAFGAEVWRTDENGTLTIQVR